MLVIFPKLGDSVVSVRERLSLVSGPEGLPYLRACQLLQERTGHRPTTLSCGEWAAPCRGCLRREQRRGVQRFHREAARTGDLSRLPDHLRPPRKPSPRIRQGRVKFEAVWWASQRGRHLCKIRFVGLDLLDIPPARRGRPPPPIGTTGCPRPLLTVLKTS